MQPLGPGRINFIQSLSLTNAIRFNLVAMPAIEKNRDYGKRRRRNNFFGRQRELIFITRDIHFQRAQQNGSIFYVA